MKFWLLICFEAVFFPFLYLINEIKNRMSSAQIRDKKTVEVSNEKIEHLIFEVHEWAGYPVERIKKIKSNLPSFRCGLKNQLENLAEFDRLYRGNRHVSYHLTISDYTTSYQELLDKSNLALSKFEVKKVSNKGMDLAGYAYVVKNKISAQSNELVFLINSSVSGNYANRLNNYILAFEKNPNLGLIGVSYCTTINQSLINNNFTPHLQSFFLIGRSNVLHQLVKSNRDVFPGEFEINKFGIIRFGEVLLTSKVIDLGYDVGVVEPNGELVIFPKGIDFDNGYNAWKLPLGDRRLTNGTPNQVHALNATPEINNAI